MGTLISDIFKRIVSIFHIIPIAILASGLLVSACLKERAESKDIDAPQVNVLISEVSVFGGLEVNVKSDKLYVGETAVATWTDISTPADRCQVSLIYNSTAVPLGSTLKDAGKLRITVTDERGNVSPMAIIYLKDDPFTGANALTETSHPVHQRINLVDCLTTYNGYKISKVEIQDKNGVRTTIEDPDKYLADKWGAYTLIYTVSKKGCEDREVSIDGFVVNPLKWTAFQIAEADNVVHSYNFTGNGNSSEYDSDIAVSESVGLFDLQSIILEAIANGTNTRKASEVKNSLKRNHILWLGESPNPKMEEYGLFERIKGVFEDVPTGHSWHVSKLFLLGTKDVISKLGTKVLYYQDGMNSEDWEDLISYVREHQNMIFHTVNTIPWNISFENGTYDDLMEKLKGCQSKIDRYKTLYARDNVFFACTSIGNTSNSLPLNTVLTIEDIKNGKHGLFSPDLEYGADVIMGSCYYQSSAIVNGKTSGEVLSCVVPYYPTKENLRKENVWMEESYEGNNINQSTSYATPVVCAKAYLMTCAQMLANPKLTKAQARKFVRETTLDGTVNLTDRDDNGSLTKEFYGKVRVMNPEGAISLFFSSVPSTIQLSSDKPIPINHGLHKNSVVVGPGVVDKDGNEVTSENYTQMLGKKLFISPAKIYEYGYSPEDTCEYVEYLCVDDKGSGAMDRESEACKYIVSQAFKVAIK